MICTFWRLDWCYLAIENTDKDDEGNEGNEDEEDESFPKI